MRIYLAFCFFLFIASTTMAQDSASHTLSWKWPQWRMDGQKLSSKEFKQEIYKSPEAIPYYQKAKRSKIIANSMAAPILVSALFMKERNITNPNYGQNRPAMLLLALVSAGTGVTFAFNSRKNMKTAVRLRNEMVVY